jgi:hypothetical protein
MRARQSRSWPTIDATVIDARVVGTSKDSRIGESHGPAAYKTVRDEAGR